MEIVRRRAFMGVIGLLCIIGFDRRTGDGWTPTHIFSYTFLKFKINATAVG